MKCELIESFVTLKLVLGTTSKVQCVQKKNGTYCIGARERWGGGGGLEVVIYFLSGPRDVNLFLWNL